IGHHGVFSLTPVMLLAVAGVVMGTRRPGGPASGGRGPPESAALPRVACTHGIAPLRSPLLELLSVFGLLLSCVAIGFYLYESDNYGGWSNGPRWLMFLSPLWLVCMLPALDSLAKSRWGRLLALVLLALSILSMSYQSWNPWRHPWLYNWMEARGW